MKLISGSVQTSAASLSRGSAMVTTTVAISPMRILPTAPPGPAALDSSSAATDAAFLRAGNVILMMTVAITLMNHWRSAVSNGQFLTLLLCLSLILSNFV